MGVSTWHCVRTKNDSVPVWRCAFTKLGFICAGLCLQHNGKKEMHSYLFLLCSLMHQLLTSCSLLTASDCRDAKELHAIIFTQKRQVRVVFFLLILSAHAIIFTQKRHVCLVPFLLLSLSFSRPPHQCLQN